MAFSLESESDAVDALLSMAERDLFLQPLQPLATVLRSSLALCDRVIANEELAQQYKQRLLKVAELVETAVRTATVDILTLSERLSKVITESMEFIESFTQLSFVSPMIMNERLESYLQVLDESLMEAMQALVMSRYNRRPMDRACGLMRTSLPAPIVSFLRLDKAARSNEKKRGELYGIKSAYKIYCVRKCDAELDRAREMKDLAAIAKTIENKKNVESKICEIVGDIKNVPVPAEFKAIDVDDLSEQSKWILCEVEEFFDDLVKVAVHEKDVKYLSIAERLKKALLPQETTSSQPTARANTCRVLQRTRDGRQSSNDSWIVDSKYSTAFIEGKDAKVKLRPRSALQSAQHEFGIMTLLHDSNPRLFIKPYELICGWESSGAALVSDCGDDLSDMCAIVMEKGQESLTDYLKREKDRLSILHRLQIVEVLVDILVAAHKNNIVLLDFKPDNIVRCLDENSVSVWKAIDFDASRRVGEEVEHKITAQYGCFEVAKFVLSGSGTTAPRATTAMDICSLGWIVWEMLSDNGSLWAKQGISGDDRAILNRLVELSVEDISTHIFTSFPSEKDESLRRFLTDLLQVDPLNRPAASILKSNYSLFHHCAPTINVETIVQRIEKHIDMLSAEMQQQFERLQSSLDNASVRLAQEDEESLNELISILKEHRELALRGNWNAEKLVQQMQSMNASLLQSTVVDPVSAALRASDDAQSTNAKLDAILEMMCDMKDQLDDIRSLQRQQLDILRDIEGDNNFMPHLFCVVPDVANEPLDKSAPGIAKAINCVKRVKDKIVGFVWSKSRLIFICPVTLQMMPCGMDGKGYLIEMPTELMRKALPVLKIGLTLVKLALSTQGCGNLIPNIADFLPSTINSSAAVTDIINDLSAHAVDAALGTVLSSCDIRDASPQLQTLRDIFKIVAKAEGCDSTDLHLQWKPAHTGLDLTKSAMDGTYAWVSKEGKAAFHRDGKKSFKSTV